MPSAKTLRSAKLELKIKQNELRRKKSDDIPDFLLGNIEQVCKELPQIEPLFPLLQPSLINTYQRSYFLSFDGRFRITVDRNMCFYPSSGTLSARTLGLEAPSMILRSSSRSSMKQLMPI